MVVKKPFILARNFLNSPGKVLVLSTIFFLINFFINGNFIRLLNLKNEIEKLNGSIKKNKYSIEQIENNLSKTNDPIYMERQAREKLDLVSEDDLVFIFPGEESVAASK